MMNRQFDLRADATLFRFGLAVLVLLGWLVIAANGQEKLQPEASNGNSSIRATHVLGLEGVHRNTRGELSIQGDRLQFQAGGNPVVQVNIASIQNISLGDDDKQVGGVPMMLGKAAVPFGGGRVVSLFSHKKYDSLTIGYLDSNGGFRGVVFRMKKGQAQLLKDDLIARGAHISELQEPILTAGIANERPEDAQQWSVLVRLVDPGGTSLDPSFSDAIYENLLKELPRSKHFKNVFRSGDRNANDAAGLLVLKTLVTKYSPGSETRRAVTTVTGATKVNVQIQLLTLDGRVVLERSIQGNVRFFGENLRAASKVAHNAAQILARSTLPEPSTPSVVQRASGTNGNDSSKSSLVLAH
ncbi:MAG TPA: hypothetical protein VFQ41_20085 [Candidatus Angelobacter sp.]|nr:hypothetical protein [Candidatus Angelobacter sp.]